MRKPGLEKDTIHSETYFIYHLLKFIVIFPIIIFLYLFSSHIRRVAKEEFTILKSFFVEAKFTTFLIFTNLFLFFIEIILVVILNYSFIPDYIIFFQENLSFPHTIFVIFFFMVLHASVAHLFGNMLFLFVFGRIVEKEYGSKKMILIYFVSAIVSSFFAFLFSEPGIGASGAIAGLIATAILVRPFSFTYFFGVPLPIIVVGWIGILADALSVINGVSDNIGHFAHIGGYAAVIVLVFLFHNADRKKLLTGFVVNILFILLFIILAIVIPEDAMIWQILSFKLIS